MVAEHGPPRRIQRRTVEEIAGVLVPRILEMSTEIAEKNDDHEKFYEQFGECSNPGNREDSTVGAKIADVLRLNASVSEDEQLNLKEYVDRTRDEINDMYSTIGESIAAVSSFLILAILRKNSLEVPQIQYIDKTIDVPVPQIQEETVEVRQVQFIDKAVDVPVVMRRQVPIVQKVQRTVEVPQAQSTDKVMDVPVIIQRQVPTVQAVQKTVDVPQVQFPDRMVNVPVVMQGQVLASQTVQKTLKVPQVQILDRVVDVPVVAQRQMPQERIVEETDVPVTRVKEEIIEVVKEMLFEGVKPIPQERVQNYTVKHTVDVPVPQILEEIGGRIQLILQERMSDRVVEQIVDAHVRQIREHMVEVVRAMLQERMQQRTQAKDPAVQVAQKTVEIQQAQVPDKVDAFVPVAGTQVQVVDVPAFLDRVDDVPVSRQRQTLTTREVPKTVNSPHVQLIDKVVNIPLMAQRQVPSAQKVLNTVEMPQIQYCSNRTVPQIIEQIVEAPQLVPREFVLSPREGGTDGNHRLAPQKRKSISECGMTEDEPSEHDVSRASASSCEVSCEAHSLVQGGRVDSKWTRLEKGTRQTKGKVSVCSRWRLTWRPVAHTSRPRQRRSKSSTGPKTCARSAEWSSSLCAAKGSST